MIGVGVFDLNGVWIWLLDLYDGDLVLDMFIVICEGFDVVILSVMCFVILWVEVDLFVLILCLVCNIFCVGKNYWCYVEEFVCSGFDMFLVDVVLEYFMVFIKVFELVIGDGEIILYFEGISQVVDYEVELVVVIGWVGCGICCEQVMLYVFGYIIVNDVIVCDWQQCYGQWFLGKLFDMFCLMGLMLVIVDEFDLLVLDICCWVNDELCQQVNMCDLIFDIFILIVMIFVGIILQFGDIIVIGMFEGVGVGFDLLCFLWCGNEVVIEIQGIGWLVNDVF